MAVSRRVVFAAATLAVLASGLAAAGLGADGVTPAVAILSMTVEAPFQAAPPTALADTWLPIVLGLVVVVALGFGIVALRRPPPV